MCRAGWRQSTRTAKAFRPRLFHGGVLLALVYLAAFTSMFFTIALLWQAGLGSVPSNLAL